MGCSIREISKRAGISPAAVSMALRDHPRISEATRRRIKKLAKAMGHQPNAKVNELMSFVRGSGTGQARACFAVISFYPTPRPWEKSVHFARIYAGMTRRATELGYRLEPLWLKAPNMTTQRFNAILNARGIEGILCFGGPDFDQELSRDFARNVIVTIGLSIPTPLHRVTQHAYNDTLAALRKVQTLGYRRPGLIIGQYEDGRSAHAYVSAYFGWCETGMGAAEAIPPLRLDGVEEGLLDGWLKKHRPDVVILVHVHEMLPLFAAALRRLGIRMGKDIGVVAISQIVQGTGFSGLQENQDLMGAWAVELLQSRIMNRDIGIPSHPRIEMVESRWIDGDSLRRPAR